MKRNDTCCSVCLESWRDTDKTTQVLEFNQNHHVVVIHTPEPLEAQNVDYTRACQDLYFRVISVMTLGLLLGTLYWSSWTGQDAHSPPRP